MTQSPDPDAAPPSHAEGVRGLAAFLHERPQLAPILRKAVEREAEINWTNPGAGWQAIEVGLGGGVASLLATRGIIAQTYRSNSTSLWRLGNRAHIEAALALHDAEAEEAAPLTPAPPGQAGLAVVSEADAAHFQAKLDLGVDVVDWLAAQIAPRVHECLDAKRACLLVAASLSDEHENRGRLHALLSGEPGTAKTAITRAMCKLLGWAFTSYGTTRVGLTVDLRTGELGVLPASNGAGVGVNEMEKFPHSDQWGCLDAMEEGIVQVSGGGHHVRADAQVRVISTSNDPAKIYPALLDRFDFHIGMPTVTKERARAIKSPIVHGWRRPKGTGQADLPAWLAWTQGFRPSFGDAARADVERLFDYWIELAESEKFPVRSIEAILRCADAAARLERRDVDVGHAARAITYLNPGLNGGKLQAVAMYAEKLIKGQPTGGR